MPSANAPTHVSIQKFPSNRIRSYSKWDAVFGDLLPFAMDFSCFLSDDGEGNDSAFSDPPIPHRPNSCEQYDGCLCSEIDRFVARQRAALRAVYDLVIRSEHTQAEAAAILSVSQQRVATLKAELLSKIRCFVGDAH